MDTARFIHQIESSTTIHPDGTRTTTTDTAVWTLAHRGHSGGGRLDIWVYPTEQAAQQAGAQADLSAMRWRDFERAYQAIITSTVDRLCG